MTSHFFSVKAIDYAEFTNVEPICLHSWDYPTLAVLLPFSRIAGFRLLR